MLITIIPNPCRISYYCKDSGIIALNHIVLCDLGPLVLAEIYFNPDMDK